MSGWVLAFSTSRSCSSKFRRNRSFPLEIAKLILDSYPEFSDSPDADLFLAVFMAIYGEQQIACFHPERHNFPILIQK
jgi:hypothetical protein